MRRGKGAVLAMAAAALAGGAIAACSAGSAVTPAPSTRPTTSSSAPAIAVEPGAIYPKAILATPSQARCLAGLHYRCLTPEQVEAAYNLGPLYARGITGKGETIVIVDAFGSPTICRDLAVFDRRSACPRRRRSRSSRRRARSRRGTPATPT